MIFFLCVETRTRHSSPQSLDIFADIIVTIAIVIALQLWTSKTHKCYTLMPTALGNTNFSRSFLMLPIAVLCALVSLIFNLATHLSIYHSVYRPTPSFTSTVLAIQQNIDIAQYVTWIFDLSSGVCSIKTCSNRKKIKTASLQSILLFYFFLFKRFDNEEETEIVILLIFCYYFCWLEGWDVKR